MVETCVGDLGVEEVEVFEVCEVLHRSKRLVVHGGVFEMEAFEVLELPDVGDVGSGQVDAGCIEFLESLNAGELGKDLGVKL